MGLRNYYFNLFKSIQSTKGMTSVFAAKIEIL